MERILPPPWHYWKRRWRRNGEELTFLPSPCNLHHLHQMERILPPVQYQVRLANKGFYVRILSIFHYLLGKFVPHLTKTLIIYIPLLLHPASIVCFE
jgi:hypothetical protein